jgi:hypothetical protein
MQIVLNPFILIEVINLFMEVSNPSQPVIIKAIDRFSFLIKFQVLLNIYHEQEVDAFKIIIWLLNENQL